MTRKLKEVSRFSSAKQRQGSVENSVLHMQNCFLLIRYIVVVFYHSRCLHPVQLSCSINRFYIFFEETISIKIKRASLLALAKSIYCLIKRQKRRLGTCQ